MTTALINADVASWNDEPSRPGADPPYRSARRGEVVEMPAEEFARLAAVKVTRHYPAPAGVGGPGATVARLEAAVVDPNAPKAEADDRVALAARVAELETELAEARAAVPPDTAAATASTAVEVVLPPSITGVRLPPGSDVPLGATATGPAGAVDLAAMSAGDLERHLQANPGAADAVASAEEARPRPRSSVLAAVEAARSSASSS